MTEQANDATTRETVPCLVRIGRGTGKTHRGEVTYEITDAGQPWQRKRLVDVRCTCRMLGGVGRLTSRGARMAAGKLEDATCEWCNPK